MKRSALGLDMPETDPERSQIPNGVQDRFLVEAARRRQAEKSLRECFARWGYHEVVSPTYEYYENLSAGASERFRNAMYRFFDRDGRTLALRADFTPQIARMAATKLYDQPMPLRCSYMGSIFRYEEPQAGRNREFTQAGIELVGANTVAADAEVVALAIAALDALDVEGYQINLGQMAFFRALTAGLAADILDPIREAIDQKNNARLDEALTQGAVGGPQGALLGQLPDLVGGPEVLDEALALGKQMSDDPAVVAALERLVKVYELLAAYGVADRVIVDLGEVRGMDYYTGITFRGVAPRLGWPLVSGGRYDNLIAQFGRPLAAVGFGIGIERALLVQNHRNQPSIVPHVLVQSCGHSGCLGAVQHLRQMGCRVEMDVIGSGEASLAAEAAQRRIPRTLRCDGDGWLLGIEGAERRLSSAELLAGARSW